MPIHPVTTTSQYSLSIQPINTSSNIPSKRPPPSNLLSNPLSYTPSHTLSKHSSCHPPCFYRLRGGDDITGAGDALLDEELHKVMADIVAGVMNNIPYPHFLLLSIHPINTPYQYTLSIPPINTPYQHTISIHYINTPYQYPL